jgi:hypothetical protein
MKKLTLLFCTLLAISYLGYSRPEYSILQSYGTKCSNCHVNIQGGGERTLGGWMSRNQTSIIDPSTIGIGKIYDFLQNTNQAWNGKITYGLDFRWEDARWGYQEVVQQRNPPLTDTVLSKPLRDNMIMQFDPYLSIKPFDFLELEGFYNFAYDIEQFKRYPGQQPYAFSIKVKPADYLPELRVGYFQPEIGTKWDDHSLLVRQVIGSSRSSLLIPDDYAEWGAELDYESIPWLGVGLGVFDSKVMKNLTLPNQTGSSIPVVSGNTTSLFFKLAFYPPEWIPGFTNFFGGYFMINSPLKTDNGIYFANNYYAIGDLFFNIGMTDKFALMTEYMWSKKEDLRTTNNLSFELTYQPLDAAYVYARYEVGNTDYLPVSTSYHANQYVLGTKIFLLPYIALIPEYRVFDRANVPGYFAEWAFQLHIFY